MFALIDLAAPAQPRFEANVMWNSADKEPVQRPSLVSRKRRAEAESKRPDTFIPTDTVVECLFSITKKSGSYSYAGLG